MLAAKTFVTSSYEAGANAAKSMFRGNLTFWGTTASVGRCALVGGIDQVISK